MARVVLAMSGGVDSSVAAALLQRQGHEVLGLFMRTGAYAESEAADADPLASRRARTCCAVSDALDARAVADRLDIPFFVLDFERDFARIMDDFADEYLAGRTPNPCVHCNVWLKFGRLWEYGQQAGADYVATGHYAQIVPDASGRPRVARAADRGKDQSYVLFGLTPELLRSVLLPVGAYPKAEIRAMARDLGLPVHDKPDSQEVCFIPDDDHARFVRSRRPDHEPTAGAIVDETGRVVGQHDGYERYTIGQRRGLGVAAKEPRYVVQIEPASRVVTIGPRPALERPGLLAERFGWQTDPPAAGVALPCIAQIRARHEGVPATAWLVDGDPTRVQVQFATPQPAVTPGQVVALYEPEGPGLLLGGGWIERALDAVAPAPAAASDADPGCTNR